MHDDDFADELGDDAGDDGEWATIKACAFLIPFLLTIPALILNVT
jgi:hypothetical protein